MKIARLFVPILGVAASFLTAACGSGGGSVTGPSVAQPATAAASVSIDGTIDDSGSAASRSGVSSLANAGIRVSVVGTTLATTSDASGHFRLDGVPAGAVALRFEAPGVDARLDLGGLSAGQTVAINVHVSGSQAAIVPRNSQSPSPVATPSPDDHGVDGPNHNAGDDNGVDGPNHDAGDDNGNDDPNHDAGDDNGGNNGNNGGGGTDDGSGHH